MRYINESGYSDFKNLVVEGDEGEQIVKLWLLARGNTNIVHIDDAMKEDATLSREDWDWRFDDKSGNVKTVEVKTQNSCHEHKGVNVEYLQSGIPSGIELTKADYWIYVNPVYGFGVISTSNLLALHNEGNNEFTHWSTQAKNKAKGWILPHKHLLWIE